MTLALEMEQKLAEGIAKGKIEMLKELVQKGMLTIKEAAAPAKY